MADIQIFVLSSGISSLISETFVAKLVDYSNVLRGVGAVTVSVTVPQRWTGWKRYATLNPYDKHNTLILSNGNLTANAAIGTGFQTVRATSGKTTGKWYFETTIYNVGVNALSFIGVQDNNSSVSEPIGASGFLGYSFSSDGSHYSMGALTSYGPSSIPINGDTYGFAVDMDAKKLWIRNPDGTWANSGDPYHGLNPAMTWVRSEALFPACSVYRGTSSPTINNNFNFGASAFIHSIPTTYLAWYDQVGPNYSILSLNDKSQDVELYYGYRQAIGSDSPTHQLVRATQGKTVGKWYWEVSIDGVTADSINIIGIQDGIEPLDSYLGQSGVGYGWGYSSDHGAAYAAGAGGGLWYDFTGPGIIIDDFSESGWNGYTVRNRIDSSAYNSETPIVGSKIRITYKAPTSAITSIGKSYIGYSASGADFSSTPVQVLFSGQPGVVIPAGSTVISDAIDFPFDKTKSLIISAYFDDVSSVVSTSVVGYSEYWAAGDDASTINTTGYVSVSDRAILIDGLEVLRSTYEDIGIPLSNGTVGFALDLDNKALWVRDTAGVWMNLGDPETGVSPMFTWGTNVPLFPAVSFCQNEGTSFTFNFGDAPFDFLPVPSGYNRGWYEQAYGNARFDGTSILYSDSYFTRLAMASRLLGVGALVADGYRAKFVSALLNGATEFSGSLKAIRQPTTVLTGIGTLSASLFIIKFLNAKLQGSGNVSVSALKPQFYCSARLAGTGNMLANVTRQLNIRALWVSTSSIKVSTQGKWYGSARLSGISKLGISTQGKWYGNARFAGSAKLTVSTRGKWYASTKLLGSGLLTVHVGMRQTITLSATFLGASGLRVIATGETLIGARFTGKSNVVAKSVGPWHISVDLVGSGYWWPFLGQRYPIDSSVRLSGNLRINAQVAHILSRAARNDVKMLGQSSLACEAEALYLFTDPLNSGIVRDAGELVLYRSSTGLEKAMADVDAYRLTATYAELIRDQWDPYAISYTNLPYLAWAMGSNLWESIWSESTKREWTADQWKFKALRGTPDAFNKALNPSGYDVVDMVRPPQGFWASPDMTKEQWDDWIRQMPELRFFYQKREGTFGVDEWFCDRDDSTLAPGSVAYLQGLLETADVGFAGHSMVSLDDGFVLRGRYAVIRHLGVDTPIYSIEYHPGEITTGVFDYERLSTIGKMRLGFSCDEDAADDERYVDCEDLIPKIYTLHLNREYSHDASLLSLTMTVPDLTPIIPRFETNSDIGDGGPWSFANTFADEWQFADLEDGGGRLLADRIYLLDPDVVEPMMAGVSFSDESRVGIPSYYGELQIDLHGVEKADAIFEEIYFVDFEMFAVPEDTERIDRATRAVLEAKALRDTIAMSFAPKRPLQFGDYLSSSSLYGDWIAEGL